MLTEVQKALIRLTALTACQTWKPLARYTLSAYCFGDFYTRGTLNAISCIG